MSTKPGQKRTKAFGLNLATMFASNVVDFGTAVGSRSQASATRKLVGNPFKKFNLTREQFKKITDRIRRHRLLAICAIFLVLIAFFAIFKTLSDSPASLIGRTSTTNFTPQTQLQVNRRFEIPIRDQNGQETGNKLAITLSTIDRSKRILIQGKPATARDTKSFLIVNLEINNSTTNQLTIRPVDFIRLVDAQQNSFAPDVHNNEVIAEPVSIKRTRVGFVIDENQRNFKFLAGELKGNKETVEVTI